MKSVEERVEDLEVKVAFQENLLGELDAVLRELRESVDELNRGIAALREEASREQMGDQPGEKPPHYSEGD